MSTSWPSWLASPKQRNRALLIAVLVVAISAGQAAWAALLPFFLGIILAYLLLPMVNWLDGHAPRLLRRWGWSRPLAILLVYLTGLGLVAGVLTVFIPAVIEQASLLAEATPGLLVRLEGLLSHDLVELLDRIPPGSPGGDANLSRPAPPCSPPSGGRRRHLRTLFQTVSFIWYHHRPVLALYVLNDESSPRVVLLADPESAREDDSASCASSTVSWAPTCGAVLLSRRGDDGTIVLWPLASARRCSSARWPASWSRPYLGPFMGAVAPVLIAWATIRCRPSGCPSPLPASAGGEHLLVPDVERRALSPRGGDGRRGDRLRWPG